MRKKYLGRAMTLPGPYVPTPMAKVLVHFTQHFNDKQTKLVKQKSKDSVRSLTYY